MTINKESCYIGLIIVNYSDRIAGLKYYDSILGLQGNRSRGNTWKHVIKVDDSNDFNSVLDYFFSLMSKNHRILMMNQGFEGATLLFEYFSENNVGTELTKEIVAKMGKLGIGIAFNHYTYETS